MEKINEVSIVKLKDIEPNPHQPRTVFDENSLVELSDSIKNYGILQPVTVKYLGNDKYQLVMGERRYRASLLLGLETIPCIIVDIDDDKSAMVAMIENLQREDLNFFEEAIGYHKLINEHGISQKELSSKIGKNQSTISNKLRILALSDEERIIIVEAGLSERHSRALIKVDDLDLRMSILNTVIEKKLNVKQTEELIDRRLKIDKKKRQKVFSKINYKIYVNTIKTAFKSIKDTGVDIEYEEDDFEDYIEVKMRIPKN
ncbi:MAG: ParB/RepB/Spo0J family partition protein [Firmicutes bacterium]|jgi:ParB family chromosome partitioning protein|nr:ParB/RepB/Spo0J family partition protein [Bacillota bacterium]